MSRLHVMIVALCFFGGVAAPAVAETVSLACSSTPGAPPTMYFNVDLTNAMVTMDSGVNSGAYAAQVTQQYVHWNTPDRSVGGGFIPAASYYLDRQSGALSVSGNGFSNNMQCQRGERPGRVL